MHRHERVLEKYFDLVFRNSADPFVDVASTPQKELYVN